MSRLGLTPEQARLLAYIAEFSEREGHSPSYEQMKRAMGLVSKSGINRLVVALEERGAIVRLPNYARAIAVIDQPNLPRDLEQRISAYCRRQGITRATFDQRAAEQHLRSVA